MRSNFLRSLMAVVAGNAVYFGIMRYLPAGAQHMGYGIDAGLLVDFCICAVCYGIVWLVWRP